MPFWTPENKWQNQEVFIIGGGTSLKKFDWNLLKCECVIGCNDAYAFGQEVCDICIFGDSGWFELHKRALSSYKGAVFTTAPEIAKSTLPWLWHMNRMPVGLHHDALGWNKNTGSQAINLALILGASKIYLLGFDMHLSKDKQSNWHKNPFHTPTEQDEVYPKFINSFETFPRELAGKFPGREIINITDGSSLDVFPKIGVKEFWENRKAS